MIHEMRLHKEPFEKIKAGTKTIEIRLYDEKRQLIKVGDNIQFTSRANGETILTEVVALHKFKSFADLYKSFDKVTLGYNTDEVANPNDMAKYYTKEDQAKYGVVGIEIKKI